MRKDPQMKLHKYTQVNTLFDFQAVACSLMECLAVFAVWQAIGVNKINAKMHHQLAKELRLLVGGFIGEGTFVATPDLCHHCRWCFQNKSYGSQGSVCTHGSDLPSFGLLLWLLLSSPSRHTASRLCSRFSTTLIIYFLFY